MRPVKFKKIVFLTVLMFKFLRESKSQYNCCHDFLGFGSASTIRMQKFGVQIRINCLQNFTSGSASNAFGSSTAKGTVSRDFRPLHNLQLCERLRYQLQRSKFACTHSRWLREHASLLLGNSHFYIFKMLILDIKTHPSTVLYSAVFTLTLLAVALCLAAY